jgi:hypothetical protein
MDTRQAFMMGQLNRHQPRRVFDWIKAARLIVEHRPIDASAGLQGDWEWTGGLIWESGRPVPAEDTYTYLASTWAIPEIELDLYVIDCWIWQTDSPGWDSETYWPPEALALIEMGQET